MERPHTKWHAVVLYKKFFLFLFHFPGFAGEDHVAEGGEVFLDASVAFVIVYFEKMFNYKNFPCLLFGTGTIFVKHLVENGV